MFSAVFAVQLSLYCTVSSLQLLSLTRMRQFNVNLQSRERQRVKIELIVWMAKSCISLFWALSCLNIRRKYSDQDLHYRQDYRKDIDYWTDNHDIRRQRQRWCVSNHGRARHMTGSALSMRQQPTVTLHTVVSKDQSWNWESSVYSVDVLIFWTQHTFNILDTE
jgi:hypothetical protein